MILKTDMNERGLRALPVAEQERGIHLQGMLLYCRVWYKPESVTNQSSRNACGHIYTPFGSGEAMAEKKKSAVA